MASQKTGDTHRSQSLPYHSLGRRLIAELFPGQTIQSLLQQGSDTVEFRLHCAKLGLAYSCNFDRLFSPGSRFGRDRKSTRLNSSHVKTSYAVFCLKKKKTT